MISKNDILIPGFIGNKGAYLLLYWQNLISHEDVLIYWMLFLSLDYDECGNSPCDPNGSCTNIPGSFTCECNDGYSGDGATCSGT